MQKRDTKNERTCGQRSEQMAVFIKKLYFKKSKSLKDVQTKL